MTKVEEAILKLYLDIGEYKQLMQMLEQEPKTDGDCISREQAIKCLKSDFVITGRENMETVVNYINSAHDKIMNLPSVKAEPKTGYWIDMDEGFSPCECSNCGRVEFIKSKYCPNCGAKMENEI